MTPTAEPETEISVQGIYFEGNSKKQAVGEWESERVAGGGGRAV